MPFSIDNERSEAPERDLQERLKAAGDSTGIDMRALTHDLAGYREPHHGRSVVEILITVVPLVLLWLSMWFALKLGYGLYLLLAVPAAGFLVRLFMIQHDCGHGSFFRHRPANDWLGRAIGVLTLTPYDFWRRTHALHHATSGNLDRRGIGDVDTLTVGEYLSLSRWGRLRYRVYRHPLVMFGLGPAYLFFLQHRFPVGLTSAVDGGRSCIPLRDSPGFSPGSLSRCICNMPRSTPAPRAAATADQLRRSDYSAAQVSLPGRRRSEHHRC